MNYTDSEQVCNFRFYFPITTMVLLSLVLSLIVYLVRKFF
ncbi:MAG: DUF2905 family protein [Bacteroidales bacterium]|nr:DUF2905 family protein [Bacteroidales bacterium]MCF8344415.1 DUF2905 family protein [Bacteroidales bacterium]MCF8349613.1 DUF2905 family protein [Bacteroidales bacterium]MCF8376054.1 DUF2905 family protein [Bacteroidales bacterium]MCF8400413.1 DUF2905 family protein [Bacteroidales bacterium]